MCDIAMDQYADTRVNLPAVSLMDTQANLIPLGLIAMNGTEQLAEKIDRHMLEWYYTTYPECRENELARETFICKATCKRFSSGDAKGQIEQSIRGYDLYMLSDVGNYSCTYPLCGIQNAMSPDDHYQDLKRIISAVGGKASRLTVIMPLLYGGRQHKRVSRESLDAAVSLRELENMGVSGLITFDAHDPRVQNATPLMGFDNALPTYQMLKALLRRCPDIEISKDKLMIVSPDEGAMSRTMFYASVMELNMGMFYKRRDYSRLVGGRNPIVAHEYLGESVKGRDIFVCDDIISSGESLLSVASHLKEMGCGRIFLSATYALFTDGLDAYDKAYEEGLFDVLLSTNLTYQKPELLARPWYCDVDVSKYVAYFILAMHQNRSISSMLDPHEKIVMLLEKFKNSSK